jgi:hypothetical protein
MSGFWWTKPRDAPNESSELIDKGGNLQVFHEIVHRAPLKTYLAIKHGPAKY